MRDASYYLELVTPPESEPLDGDFVRDQHLRAAAGSAEDDYIDHLIVVARRMAERITRRALVAQTWSMSLEQFPACGEIVIPRPPLQSVDSIVYLDADGVEQTWGGSPLPYDVTMPGGPYAKYGRIRPAYGEVWPTTRSQSMSAVTVTFSAGYPDGQIPEDILHAMLLTIGEMYKQRSESVHAFNQNPALIRARDLWLGYRVY